MPARAGLRKPRWTPAGLSGKHMAFWYDALDTPTDGTGVALWKDKSPTRADLVQATGSKQPIVRQYGHLGQLSGKRSVGGDAVDDVLIASGVANPIDGAAAVHLFLCVTRSSGSSVGYWLSMERGSGANGLDMDDWRLDIYASSFVQVNGNFSTDSNGLPVVLEIMYDSGLGSAQITVNGEPTIQGTASGNVSLAGFNEIALFNVGTGFNSPAGQGIDIHEVLGFGQRITGADRHRMIRYLCEKWGARRSPDPYNGTL